MRHLDKTFAGFPSDALRGRIGGGEFGVGPLQPLELPHHSVVFGVGDGRLIQNVIQVFVTAEFVAETFYFATYFGVAHIRPI
jgi:hypothetical protein